MRSHSDEFTASDENTLFKLSVLSVPGDREEQQDCVGFTLHPDEGLVTVCDGMGGHEGGKTASALAVDTVLRAYGARYPCPDPEETLLSAANEADRRVSALAHGDGTPLNAGSTLTAVHIGGREMRRISVGDSRIYVWRDGELARASKDHNYRELLGRQLSAGEIDRELYDREIRRGDALTSYIGVGGLPEVDLGEGAFILRRGDLILLTTDGLYKLLSEEEIGRILGNFTNTDEAVGALNTKAGHAADKWRVRRDNMTIALMKVK